MQQPGWKEGSSWDSPAAAPLLSPAGAGPQPPQGPPGDPHTTGFIHPHPLLPAPSHPQPHPPAAPRVWSCPGEVLGWGGLWGLTWAIPPHLQHPRVRPAEAVPGPAELHGEVFTFWSVGRRRWLFLSWLSAPAGTVRCFARLGRGGKGLVGSTGWDGEQGSVGSGGEQPPGVLQELPVLHKGQGVQGI